MNPELLKLAAILGAELDWFEAVMAARFDQYFSADDDPKKSMDVRHVLPLDLKNDTTIYGQTIQELGIGFDERIILVMALVPHLRPQAFDMFCLNNKNLDRPYTEFGGWKGKTHIGFMPTCETVSFILAGQDLDRRLQVLSYFEEEATLIQNRIIRIEHQGPGEPFASGIMHMAADYLQKFTTGIAHKPDYCIEFPAKRITSKLSWEDLVLAPETMEEIQQITTWISGGAQSMKEWGIEKNVKPGYRSLFYGPPGTGKTLTATLIGEHAGVDVYRIDLSMVVSKYIGETEKNLSNVFDQAERRNWILFFDEADALFGKRTQTSNSNDRHANQEISYLLQRVEDFPGVVILASNLKQNIDEAFARRFQSTIYFPMPDPSQRFKLWNNLFPQKERLGPDVDFDLLAEQYELAGGSLTNVARFAVLKATGSGRSLISQSDLLEGVAKELMKEGKIL